MVHVMSEHSVIYLSPSDDPEREWCQDDVWENSVRYNLGTDFDAQRLRADTAEAELAIIRPERNLYKASSEALEDQWSAAEQRIAEQNSLIEEIATEMTLAISDSQTRAAMTSVGRTRFLQILQTYNARIDSALNQKSEGES